MRMLTIRTAGVADAATLQQVARESYLHHFAHLWQVAAEMEEFLADEYNRDTLEAELANPEILWLLAESAGQPIGFAKVCWNRPRPDNNEPGALLQKLYLMPEQTGQGYGRQLWEQVLAAARQQGQKSLWLTVLQNNPRARTFYLRHGMESIQTLPFSSVSQRSLMDLLVMPLP
ncbi:N-acetyltransferase [Chimaeribacter arupi]|uniref:N-acetyltransferase n=2 Tax=Yersiniaceae TaxID=1903411 RepID=A0A2N5EIN0_9GAMM|nr:N-acetyltransferase [Chimaeribacter arupi]PLR44732.1 N-acetyltransferase [Chimaeribacter arupi]PLR47104.1 N-acetyltransferase [Chimaeribacter arupi]